MGDGFQEGGFLGFGGSYFFLRPLSLRDFLLCLRIQTGILNSDGGLCSEGQCQLRVLLGVEARLMLVQSEHPHDAIPDQQRHSQPAVDVSGARLLFEPVIVGGSILQDERSTAVHYFDVRDVLRRQVESYAQYFLRVGKAMSTDDFQLVVLE